MMPCADVHIFNYITRGVNYPAAKVTGFSWTHNYKVGDYGSGMTSKITGCYISSLYGADTVGLAG